LLGWLKGNVTAEFSGLSIHQFLITVCSPFAAGDRNEQIIVHGVIVKNGDLAVAH